MSISSQKQQSQKWSISAAVGLLFLALLATTKDTAVLAFQPISLRAATTSQRGIKNRRISSFSSSSSNLYAQQESTSPSPVPAPRRAPRPGEFELQELKVNLDSMRKQNVASRDLQSMKRLELQGYAEKVTQSMDSSIPLSQLDRVLPGTKWRLQFSTQPLVGTDLPPDATITLTFYNDNVMDYSLEFSEKTFGLNAIKATSRWSVGDNNNDDGIVTFVYDEIKTNAFGFKDVPTGFFGLLKGRTNYIQSVFMDDQIWIERGYSSPDDGQQPYYNVYVKEEQETS